MLQYAARSLGRCVISLPRDLGAWFRFWKSYFEYHAMALPDARPSLRHLYPCLGDDVGQTSVEPVYFYQDAWAFEKIVSRRPTVHVDVGSHHKYVALLSKVIQVIMVDIRPLSLSMESIQFRQGSILDLPFDDGSVPSVSSLCVIEHIGLGRYGDALDPLGSEKAIAELQRIVAPRGDLYVSAPIDDRSGVYFNAHRVFAEEYLLSLFAPFRVEERWYIYGTGVGDRRRPGPGVGGYHLRRP